MISKVGASPQAVAWGVKLGQESPLSPLPTHVGRVLTPDDKTHLLEETLDVRLQRIQLRGLSRDVFVDRPGSTIQLTTNTQKRDTFVREGISDQPELKAAAQSLLDTIVQKMVYKQAQRPLKFHLPGTPAPTALKAIEHYAIKAGDELREVIEIVEGKPYPKRAELPALYQTAFPLLLDKGGKLCKAVKKGTPLETLYTEGLQKLLKRETDRPQLTKALKEELKNAETWVKTIETDVFGHAVPPQAWLPVMTYKTALRATQAKETTLPAVKARLSQLRDDMTTLTTSA